MCSGSAVASNAFSTLALNAIRLSISVTKLQSLSSSSFFQYLMSSILCSEISKHDNIDFQTLLISSQIKNQERFNFACIKDTWNVCMASKLWFNCMPCTFCVNDLFSSTCSNCANICHKCNKRVMKHCIEWTLRLLKRENSTIYLVMTYIQITNIYLKLPNFLLTSLWVFSVRFAVSSDKRLDSSTSLSEAALSDSAFA